MKTFATLSIAFLISLIFNSPSLTQTITPEIKKGGYVQVRYTTDEDAIDEFKVRRARLKFSGELAKDIRFLLLVDAVTTPILWKAHIDISYKPWVSIRIGQFKTPFSHEYLTSSSKLDMIDRSQVVSALAVKYDIGLQVYGTIECFSYAIGTFNGSGKNASDVNNRKDMVGMIVAKPIPRTEIGVSGYYGKSGVEKRKKDRIGTYVTTAYKSACLGGEYIYAKDGSLKKDGWYAQIAYRFYSNFQGLVRYDTYNPDKDISKNSSNYVVIGINWFPNTNTKIQINYLFRDDSEITDALKTQFQVTF